MKIKGARQVHYDSGPNMTPLVDVVMVILIFLMLAGSFAANEHYLTSDVPIKQSGGAKDPNAGEFLDDILEISIVSDGGKSFRVAGGDINLSGLTTDVNSKSRELLIQKLSAKKKLLVETAKTPVDKIQVVLAPSATTRYEHIALVYEAALKAEFTKIAFRTAA